MGIRRIHADTAEGWDAIAASKYRAELADRARLLRSGHSLLAVEVEEMRDLLPGASVLHLQCSHGLDGLSVLRLGASALVGIDISAEMIRQARELTDTLGYSAHWIHADVLTAPAELDSTADLVYTGKGALPWIMDLTEWAAVVRRTLRPGGHLYVLEGHPLDNLWDRDSDTLKLRESGPGYFDEVAAENPGFPAAALSRVHSEAGRPKMRERHWRPDEVMAALGSVGLEFESYREHPDMFWDQFPKWPEGLKRHLPHTYSLRYRRPTL